MKKINQILGVAALVLLALSVLSYRASVSRAERFERGQKFLANLNPSEINSVVITKGDETVTLEKDRDGYTIKEAHRYPAKNEAINRFIRDVLDLSLEKQVGRGETLQAELEIEPPGESTVEVVLTNAADQEMVRFRVGKSAEDGPGNFIQRLDSEEQGIYLTSKSTFLSTDRGSFLKKEILDVAQAEIQRIEGTDFTIESNEEGQLELAGIAGSKKEKTMETSGLKSVLSRLSFDQVFLADDDEVRALSFRPALRVDLKDQSGYVLSFASKDDRSFLRIEGFHSIEQVTISQESSEEELKEKADLLSRAEEVEKFTNFHASWVYEINDTTAKKLKNRYDDLIEEQTT